MIFFHGFTNCPAQFVPLAEQFVARGYSLTDDLAGLSANELVRFALRSVDLAHGLGEQVSVAGLSMGATIAAWVAPHRGDVAQVILIAPLFQNTGLPPFAIRPVASTILAVPNVYLWWDDQRHEQIIGPPYAYPRYPVHAAGALLRLSFAMQDAAERGRPAVQNILLVSNAAAKCGKARPYAPSLPYRRHVALQRCCGRRILLVAYPRLHRAEGLHDSRNENPAAADSLG